jgi:hypothetical protein
MTKIAPVHQNSDYSPQTGGRFFSLMSLTHKGYAAAPSPGPNPHNSHEEEMEIQGLQILVPCENLSASE